MFMIVKKFEFEAAHYLPNYDGPCKNVHGHTYKLEVGVSLIFFVINENGMIIDLKLLKKIVETNILDILDHTLLNDKIENPTCENILWFIKEILKVEIEKIEGCGMIQLQYLKLHETSDSYAEWGLNEECSEPHCSDH